MQSRRDYVISEAIRAGKFTAARAKHWRKQYDRDPAGTEAAIAVLASPLDGPQPYPKELFPELSSRRRGSSPVASPTSPAATAAAPTRVLSEPQRVGSATPPPARSEQPPLSTGTAEPSAEDVAGWSSALGFQNTPVAGRVTKAAD